MSIQEQIQIVEDNLNEYGQCNITLEEFNYLKDELYSEGCLAGIELGRKEAVEEFLEMLKNPFTIDSILAAHDKFKLYAIFKRVAEQMKEGNK